MLNLQAVREAAERVRGIALRTPMVRARTVGEGPLWMKLETLQPVGAFKIRGAANAIAQIPEAQAGAGVVCCSTGNHGRAVAYAARARGIGATVCLSHLVPETKVRAIEELGARVRRVGASQDDAQVEASRLVSDDGLTEIPPFDHPHVIAGQGTIALEMLEDHPEIETILVPLSGGGLAGGVALAVKAVKPSVRVIGISMQRGAAMKASLDAGKPVEVEELPTLADSLGGGIGLQNNWTFDLCRSLLDDVVLLSEDEIYRGMQAMMTGERIVAEGGGVVGLAAVLAGKVKLDGPAATIVSGQNVAMDQLLAVARGEPVKLGDLEVRA